jgi:DNA topoisomerase VI subunit B
VIAAATTIDESTEAARVADDTPADRKPGHQFVRQTFRTSRLLDFTNTRELEAQTGHESAKWPCVVPKELVDNALDACEEAGIAPVISVVVDERGITVTDNGPGIPDGTVRGVLEFDSRVSSREAYVAPDRGAQGNALKTLIAMPCALGKGEPGRLDILTVNHSYHIEMSVNRVTQEPHIDLTCTEPKVKNGTSVTVHWPKEASVLLTGAKSQFLLLAEKFTWINPHLTLTVDWFGERSHTEATNTAWDKWKPRDPTSLHWYSTDRLKRLIGAYIKSDREAGRDRTVRDFLLDFNRLKGSTVRTRVTDEAEMSRTKLSEVDQDEMVERLLLAGQNHTKPVKPLRLGLIGEDHLKRRMIAAGCYEESFQYKKVKGGEGPGEVPWVAEAAFAYFDEERSEGQERLVVTGVNWSPAIEDPFARFFGYGGFGGLLSEQKCRSASPVIAFLHLACARVEQTDRGKSAIHPALISTEDIKAAVERVTDDWAKLRRKEERQDRTEASEDERQQDRRKNELNRTKKKSLKQTIKDAAYEVMESAYRKAAGLTGMAKPRQIYYAARDHVQMNAGKCPDGNTFCQTLLVDYIRDHPETTKDWRIIWDARGNFNEPHNGTIVRLGTLEVEQYLAHLHNAHHRYGAILFIEKEGWMPAFEKVKLAQRYDIAIMSTKGMSVTAARTLIDELWGRYQIPTLVIRDFDKSGFSIVGTLGRDTDRHKFKYPDRVLIDLGLRLADIELWNLKSEYVPYKKPKGGGKAKNPADNLRLNGATEEEIAFLVSGGSPETGYHGQRVELNAFTTDDLIKWIEGKLEANGIKKVVPDQETLENAWRRDVADNYARARIDKAREEGREYADSKVAPANLLRKVRKQLERHRSIPWGAAVAEIARKDKAA